MGTKYYYPPGGDLGLGEGKVATPQEGDLRCLGTRAASARLHDSY